MKKLKFLIAFLSISLSSCSNDDNSKQDNYNPENEEVILCMTDYMNALNDPNSKPTAASRKSSRWEVGQTIKVKFLDGSNIQHELVKQYVSQWTEYANLNFEYVSKIEDAHIAVAFNLGRPGAWSEIGARLLLPGSLYFNYQNTPSMRLGDISNSDSSRRTVLHEFGHALGLVHETTNPTANINWDLPKTYKYFYDSKDWSKEEVDRQVIQKMNSNDTDYSIYAPLSIMHYNTPAYLTTDGVAVNSMSTFSN
ncbi:matrixin family metalloprotease [Flavobacterium sp.]|uniref:matrixin family metalloprotease n=1 Tax=Flavobacterium sp. TaxID=239 RepID=UPI0031DC50E1